MTNVESDENSIDRIRDLDPSLGSNARLIRNLKVQRITKYSQNTNAVSSQKFSRKCRMFEIFTDLEIRVLFLSDPGRCCC